MHDTETPMERAKQALQGLRPTRRRFVQGSSAAIAGAWTVGRVHAAPAPNALYDPRTWLLHRGTFGITPEALNDVQTRGMEDWVDWQLQPDSIADADIDSRLTAFDWLDMTALEMREHPTLEVWEIATELRAVRIQRAVYSRRQLFERVVEFWTDHFNIFGTADDTHVLKVVDDRDVIRTHALGTFRDLLFASAKSPAMLAYLDNDTNVVGAAQENYAREVMELHTLGVDGPYTEDDVRELARCFTGWGYWKSWQSGGDYGEFAFHAQDHDDDPKTVLGLQIDAGGGMSDAERVLDLLASHPKTIDFVTRKLARWFLGYAPPERAVDFAKTAWTQSGGSIAEVVRALLSPAAIRAARPWESPKFKRPLHWSISMYRATGIDLPRPVETSWHLAPHGDLPFQWGPPNGYPDAVEAWASGLVGRWRNAASFGNGWYWSTDHTVAELRALLGSTPMSAWARRLSLVFTGGTMTAHDRRVLQAHIDSFSGPTDQAVGEAFELAASTPSFQSH